MAAALESAPSRRPWRYSAIPTTQRAVSSPAGYVRRLASAYPRQLFCVDEAYRGFTDRDGNAAMDGPNILRLRSLTKLFAVPGFRIAYLCGGEARLALVHKELPIWNVGTLPIHLAQSFIQDRQHVRRTRDWLQQTKTPFYEELKRLPNLTPYPTDCNFLLFQVSGCDPKVFYDAMIKQGVVLRSCEDFEGLEPGFFRTAIRLKEENARLFKALGAALGVSTKKHSHCVKPAAGRP